MFTKAVRVSVTSVANLATFSLDFGYFGKKFKKNENEEILNVF